MNSQEIVEHLDNEIARLQQAKALLQGLNNHAPKGRRNTQAVPTPKVKRVLSAAARRKIAAAQRRRWANARKAQAKQ